VGWERRKVMVRTTRGDGWMRFYGQEEGFGEVVSLLSRYVDACYEPVAREYEFKGFRARLNIMSAFVQTGRCRRKTRTREGELR
jgi:hypothetical protein